MAHHWFRATIALLFLALGWQALSGQLRTPSLLEQVQQRGELVVVMRLGPTTLFDDGDALAGMDYDLALAFARELGVELRVLVADSKADMYRAVAAGQADIAGAVTPTAEGSRLFRFTEPYTLVDRHLVHRRGRDAPESFRARAEEEGARLHVPAGGSTAEMVRRMASLRPLHDWTVRYDVGVQDLLYEVWTGELDYTVVDSNELALSQAYFPEIRVAFTLDSPQPLAWAVDKGRDDSLHAAATGFLDRAQSRGQLGAIRERYFGHLTEFDYVDSRIFLRHVTERLPRYRDIYQEAAADNDLDWRLLAAIGYQESHWDPQAVSPTGVRGLMMLTRQTAAHLGVDNRRDPEQSIRGGARYFRNLLDRVPEQIEEPHRTWLALAAYNVGPGHVEDARRITESQGADPDKWPDVREHLPLLAQEAWYPSTRHGYARGWEPVHYVRGVRRYYALLARVTDPERYRLDRGRDDPRLRHLNAADLGHRALPARLEMTQ